MFTRASAAVRSGIGAIESDDSQRAEQRGDRPDNVYDPHWLRAAHDIDENEERAHRAQNDVEERQIVEPERDHLSRRREHWADHFVSPGASGVPVGGGMS